MGLGHISRGQIARGLFYLFIEIFFILYLVCFGGSYLHLFFYGFFSHGTVGIVETHDYWNEELGVYDKITGDNSFKIILYGILTIFIIIFFLLLYRNSIKESIELEEKNKNNKPIMRIREDLAGFVDDKFHITLLSLPMIGLFVFTFVPLITMIVIAFTNYDASTEVPQHLFSWVGLKNFADIFGGNTALSATFLRVLGWTLTWAFLQPLVTTLAE